MTVETLPPAPDFEFGKVVGRIIHAIADTSDDADDKPEARAAAGKVIFTPDETLRVVTTSGQKAFVTQSAVTANLSSNGRILDAEGRQGVWLVTGTWKVTFELNPVGGSTGVRPSLPALSIAVTTAHTDVAPLDLADAAPYTPPPNTTVQTLLVPSGGDDGDALIKSGDGLAWGAPSGGGSWGSISGTLSSQTDLQSALNGKVPTTRTVAGKALTADVTLAKGDVGLGNVDNTSDAAKPISTATQTALNGKAPLDHDHLAQDISDFNPALNTWATSGQVLRAHVRPAGDPEPDPATLADFTVLFEVSVAAPLAATFKTDFANTTDGTSFASASIDTTGYEAVLAFVAIGDSDGTASVPSSLASTGLTWTRLAAADQATGLGIISSSVWVGTGAGGVGAVTVNTAVAREGAYLLVVGLDNANPTITNVAKKTSANTGDSVTLTAPAAGSATFGFVAKASASQTVTPGAGYTLLGTSPSIANPSMRGVVFYRLDGQALVDFTASGNGQQTVIGLEVAAV